VLAQAHPARRQQNPATLSRRAGIDGSYARTGEEIGFRLGPAGPGPGNHDPISTRRYVRALTSTGFTLETVHGFSFGSTIQRGDSFVDFHR
jgi:hypothetical protein